MTTTPTAARTAAGPRTFWTVGLSASALAYLAVFALTRDAPLWHDLRATGLNVAALALAVLGARAVLRRWILPLGGWRMWAAHAALAAAFALMWAWLLYVATGIAESGSLRRFDVVPFLIGAAERWQMMQGLFAYAAVAAATVLEHRPAGALLVLDNAAPDYRERFLLRRDGEVLSLAAADIVSVIGADDYAEIVTTQGTHLASTTLETLEGALDSRRFLRVHRSAIANLDRIVRAEPVGGGRMTLVMSAGPDLAVSRSGARRLREHLL